MAIPQVSQSNFDLGLNWYKGDPVSLSWVVLNVNWSGTYTAAIYKDETAAALLATPTVTATYSAVTGDTTFVFSLSDAASDSVPAGLWYYKVRETAGLTRFAGSVEVDG